MSPVNANMGSWLSNQGGLQGMDLWGDPQEAADAGVNVNEPGCYTLYCNMGGHTNNQTWLCIVTTNTHGTGLGSSDYWTLVVPGGPCFDYAANTYNLLSGGATQVNTGAAVEVPTGIARLDGTMEAHIGWRAFNGNSRADWSFGVVDQGGSGTTTTIYWGNCIGAHYEGDSSWGRPLIITDWRAGAGGTHQGAFHPKVSYNWEANSGDHLSVYRWVIQFTPRAFIADVT